MKFLFCISTIIYLCINNTTFVKAQESGNGVVISDDSESEPDPSAILEVKSIERGVKPPHYNVTNTPENIEQSIVELGNVLPTADGLLFFIPEGNGKGFFYYDSEEKNWFRLYTSLYSEIEIPDGSIIMYAGQIDDKFEDGLGIPGTETQGWAICNGENGTPDLRGRFLIGKDYSNVDSEYQDDDETGLKGGKSSNKIEEENCELHSHRLKNVTRDYSHNHLVTGSSHDHVVDTRRGGWGSGNGGNNLGRKEYRDVVTDRTSENDIGVEYTTPPKNDSNTKFDVDIKKDNEWLEEYGKGIDNIENRPRYFTVVYIMKKNRLDDFNPESPSYADKVNQ